MRGIKKKPFFLSYPQRQTAEFESRRPTRRRHDDGWKRARPDDSNRFFFLMESLDRIQFLRNSKRARTKKKEKGRSVKEEAQCGRRVFAPRARQLRPAGRFTGSLHPCWRCPHAHVSAASWCLRLAKGRCDWRRASWSSTAFCPTVGEGTSKECWSSPW